MKRFLLCSLAAAALLTACQKGPAAGGETKDFSVQLSFATSWAKTSWTSGDKVRVFSTAEDGSVSFSSLSTSESGATAHFSASGTVKTGTHYRFIYPESKADVTASATSIFASVPARQTAQAGSADPKACILVGETSDLKKAVSMYPATAFLKFSLSGEGASDVVKVEISSLDGTVIAGDIGWQLDPTSSLYPKVSHNSLRNREAPSSTITLSGPFQAGQDYYVPVVPGKAASGFVFTVSDAESRSQVIEIAKEQALAPAVPYDLKSVKVEAFTGTGDFAPRFVYSKQGIKPYVFVFMSDGFTEAQRDKYTQAAQQAIDHIFSVQPYKGLKEYFSAYVCWTPAETSGVGTRWNTTASSGSSAMMKTYGQSGRDAIYSYVGERCPEVVDKKTPLNNVGIFMLNNNTSYIRPVCDWESSGRFVTPVGLIPNTSSGYSQWCFGGSWQNYEFRDGVRHEMTSDELIALGYASNGRRNGDYRDECLHEGAGHGFGRLGDEYWSAGNQAAAGYNGLDSYHNSTLPTMLNVAASATDVPWKVLNDMKSELVAKDARYSRVGTYEGGYGYETGIWRAEQVSAMMDNRPYFSTWERALIYMRIMRVCEGKTSFDVRNQADLETFLEFDLSVNGIRDPLRDK